MITHSGTVVEVIRSGTTATAIHSGTVVTAIHSGTTCAISLYLTAFNMWLLQAVPTIPIMCRTPKFSMGQRALTRQIDYKYRSNRRQIIAKLRE